MPQEHNPRYHTYRNFLHKSAFCNKSVREKLNFTRSIERYQGVYGDRGDLRMIRLFLRFMYFCSNFHASYCFFIRSIISAISPVPLFLCHPYRTVLSRSVFVGCSESGSGHSSDIKVYVSIIRFARSSTASREHRALRHFHFTHVNPACDWLVAVRCLNPSFQRTEMIGQWPRGPAPGNEVGHLVARAV